MRTTTITEEDLKERDVFLAESRNLQLKELFELCSKDPAIFAKYMLGVKLYAWQYKVAKEVANGNKRIILNTSRQIGKSFLVSILALWYALFNKGNSSEFMNTKVGIISATENQSKKIMYDIKNLMSLGNLYCKTHYSKIKEDLFDMGIFSYLIDDDRSADNTKTSITFKAFSPEYGILLKDSLIGSYIKCYPPTDIVRGETFDFLMIDEAAQIDDDIYYMAISKTGDKYDAIKVIASTPFGQSGFYFELVDPNDTVPNSPWTKFAFDVDAIRYDDPLDWERRKKEIDFNIAQGKSLIVRQEYYCEFVTSEQSYFDPEKVDAIFDSASSPVEGYSGLCDLGIDFGGLKKSQTVMTISMLEDGIISRIYHHAYGVREDGSLIDDVKGLCKRFNIQRIIVDNCPEGDFIIRKMLEFGWNITLMNFAGEKVKKYGQFRSKLNRFYIKSYPDGDLQGQMKALMTRQGVERTKIQPPPGYGDDYVDSFLLSAYHYIDEDQGLKFWDIDDV